MLKFNPNMTASLIALAVTPAFAGSQEYCQRKMSDFKALIQTPGSRMARENYGGLRDGGVCWWHSRLQRNSIYLSFFAPEKPKPTADQASRIVSDLINEKRVVEIPGYSNFLDFTTDHWQMVQDKLEGWQKKDGFLKFAWARGLHGSEQRNAADMRAFMDGLYEKVSKRNEIVYTKLQLEGVSSHAWLVLDMEKRDDGYTLHVIDSNNPHGTESHLFTYGDTQVEVAGRGSGGIYEDYNNTLDRLRSRFKEYCGTELK